jgi:hypothetical protein
VQSSIEFYNEFQKISAAYLLPIVPFDCISIRMGFEAICPPGLGIPKYAAIARVLVEVLPKLLPKSNSHISTLMTVVRMETNNGFDLLWRVMALAVPGFDPTIPVPIPVWNTDDIFEFAAAFTLYYRLHGKKGVYHDDRTQSLTFLQTITEPAYAKGITSQLACVANTYLEIDNGYLPSHLCIMGLATQLHKGATNRASTILPMVRRIHAQHQSTDYNSNEDFDPQVYRMQSDNARQFDGRGRDAARWDRDIPGKQDNNA